MTRYVTTPIPAQSDDFSAWFHAVVTGGMIAKHSPVPGCQILEENGADLWRQITDQFDMRIRALSYRNKGFPALIPMSLFEKEADHVEGFAPELAMVKELKGEKLADPLCLRPTSETIIYDDMANVLQSKSDLPILWNQWCDVWRVEMRTRLLLRTFQFSWHEAHWAIADPKEAMQHTLDALAQYKEFCQTVLAIPVIDGEKTPLERFAGADHTFTIEARMPDGKALQAGTSHMMGKGFAETYDIKYASGDGGFEHPVTGSWGMSTRILGAIVMVHSDDRGLVLPPRISPFQCVLMTVADKRTSGCNAFEKKLGDIHQMLKSSSIRYVVDDADERLGKKQYHWEKQGVPIRLVYGAGEMSGGTVTMIRRDTGEKVSVPEYDLVETMLKMLDDIHHSMFASAEAQLNDNLVHVSDLAEFKETIAKNSNAFMAVGWCAEDEAEKQLKKDYGYTVRCLPFDCKTDFKVCFLTGKKATSQAIIAKAY